MSESDYETIWSALSDREEINGGDKRIVLSRYRWYSRVPCTATYQDYSLIRVRPIALGYDGSYLGWRIDSTDKAFYHCPRDYCLATRLGSSIGDAVLWMIIDEMRDVWTKEGEFDRTIWNIRDWIHVFDDLLSKDVVADILDQYLSVPILDIVGGRKTRTKISLISVHGYEQLMSKYSSLSTTEAYQYVK